MIKITYSLFLLVIYYQQSSASSGNIYDTYNAHECKRVRRNWDSLTSEEQQSYVDAMMKLRERGEGQMEKDDLIAVASAHMDQYGEIAHTASSYFFWHGYLLWEIESRIRNLGGQWKCFGMPYWDFSKPDAIQEILSGDILGGKGDPDNYFNVNGYSWDYTKEQYWVPAHCDAEGDEYPICSLKRSTSVEVTPHRADEFGEGIINNPKFADFDRWYSGTINIPMITLTDMMYLHWPVVTSYDPIWYLFHSMVSYHQAIWTDCNDYDLIASKDLDNYPEAYTAFCDEPMCGDMGLDDAMYYGGLLPDKKWAFISKQDLTVRKAYNFEQWNILYELGNGEGFYTDSGLKEYCEGKLNENWFKLDENKDEEIMDAVVDKLNERPLFQSSLPVNIAVICLAIIALPIIYNIYMSSYKKKQMINESSIYGSV